MVTRLDRLARSTRDLLNTLAVITDKQAGFKSLGDTWADTTTSHGRLMLTVLGGLAEFERDLIRARTGEGRARAVARAENGPTAQTNAAPEARGDQAPRHRQRNACRHRAQLQRQRGDDFEATSMTEKDSGQQADGPANVFLHPPDLLQFVSTEHQHFLTSLVTCHEEIKILSHVHGLYAAAMTNQTTDESTVVIFQLLAFVHYHFLFASSSYMRCHMAEGFSSARAAIDGALIASQIIHDRPRRSLTSSGASHSTS
jgi:hypothetical protein